MVQAILLSRCGDNIIVGATGNDDIEVGIDNDTILGDGGVALYNAGVLVSLSSDAAEAGDDIITVVNGNNSYCWRRRRRYDYDYRRCRYYPWR